MIECHTKLNWISLCLTIIVLTSLGFVRPSSTGAATYQVVEFDVTGAEESSAYGINDAGHIVGGATVGGMARGFFYDGIGFEWLSIPGSHGTVATGVNNIGIITGYYWTDTMPEMAFVFDGQSYDYIDIPGAEWVIATDINDSGQVVGLSGNSESDFGFLLDDGELTIIEIPGYDLTAVYGINNNGKLVGSYVDKQNDWKEIGFVSDGTRHEPFEVPGSYQTALTGINDAGILVGGFDISAFVYDGSSYSVLELNDQTDLIPYGINNAGVIVGELLHEDDLSAHSFIATPVPVPGAVWLLGTGFLAILGVRKNIA